MTIPIQTSRLTILPLTNQHLRVWHQSGRKDLEKMLDLLHNPWEMELFYEQETQQALRDYWIPQTAKFPLDYYWYTNWEIILNSSSCSVGESVLRDCQMTRGLARSVMRWIRNSEDKESLLKRCWPYAIGLFKIPDYVLFARKHRWIMRGRSGFWRKTTSKKQEKKHWHSKTRCKFSPGNAFDTDLFQ